MYTSEQSLQIVNWRCGFCQGSELSNALRKLDAAVEPAASCSTFRNATNHCPHAIGNVRAWQMHAGVQVVQCERKPRMAHVSYERRMSAQTAGSLCYMSQPTHGTVHKDQGGATHKPSRYHCHEVCIYFLAVIADFLAPRSFLVRFLRSFMFLRDRCTRVSRPFCRRPRDGGQL